MRMGMKYGRRGATAAVGLLLCFWAGACGGVGPGTSTSTTSVGASADGLWTVTPTLLGSVLSNNSNAIAVGDASPNNWAVGYVRFSTTAVLAALPPGAVITNATLVITKINVYGSPFTTIGADHRIHIDHALFSTPSVVDADWSTLAPGGLDIGLLIGGTDDAVVQTFSVDVTAAFLDDLAAARANSDYKLRFPTSTNGNGVSDFARFNDSEGNEGIPNKPMLAVTHSP